MSLATAFYKLGQFLEATMLPDENMGTCTILEDAIRWQFFGNGTQIDARVKMDSSFIHVRKDNMDFLWNCKLGTFE